MISKANLISKVSFSKDFVADPTYVDVICRLNSAGETLDSNGLGTGASSTSSVWVMTVGGFNDQRVTANIKYVSPTASGSANFGPILRFRGLETSGTSTYYMARVSAGVAKISKIVAGTTTDLSTVAWALPQNTLATITFSVVGTALSATFHDTTAGIGDQTLTATDSAIASGGLMGFRSFSSSVACHDILCEQL